MGRRRDALLPTPDGWRARNRHRRLFGRVGSNRRTEDLGFRNRIFAAGRQILSRVDAKFDDLQPLNSAFKMAGISEITSRYTPGKITVATKKERWNSTGTVTTNDEQDDTRTVTTDKVYYDNEEGVYVFRSLPMAEKYQAKVPIFAEMGAGQIDIGLEVQGKESVKVPAGQFPCFKTWLPSPIGQTFWISADEHRYPVKIEANNVQILLTKIECPKPGEIRKYKDAEVALALPPRWYAYRAPPGVYLLDPDADWDILLMKTKLEKLSAEAKQSPRAWVEKGLPNAAKQLKDLKVRADSWQTMTICGRPAVSLVADYVAADGRPWRSIPLPCLARPRPRM